MLQAISTLSAFNGGLGNGTVRYGQFGPQVLYGVCPSLDIPEDALQTFPIPLSVWSV